MKSSVDFRLYLVTDRHQVAHGTLLSVLAQFIASGGPAIQLRERDLDTRKQLALIGAIQELIRSTGTKLLINDRADVAAVGKADGVHLRETSLPVPAARQVVGRDRLIGRRRRAGGSARRGLRGAWPDLTDAVETRVRPAAGTSGS